MNYKAYYKGSSASVEGSCHGEVNFGLKLQYNHLLLFSCVNWNDKELKNKN
jgi:hypothetical protein